MKFFKLQSISLVLSSVLAAAPLAANEPAADAAKAEVKPKFLGVPEYLAQPELPPDHRYQYGEGEFQFVDLRLPEGEGPFPVVILVHGGCWLAQYGLRPLDAMAESLTDAGVATWTLEFRRVGNEGGGWPGTFQDVASGTDYLREVAAENNLDLNRVIVSGHSAGGHLALWLGARHKLPEASELYVENPLALAAVVALAPAADLELTWRNQTCGDSAQKLVGGSPEEFPQRYFDGSAAALLPLGIPQVIVNGDHDEGWLIVSRAYQAKAKSLGETVKIIVPPNAGHFELVIPGNPAFDQVRETILAAVPPAD